MLRNGSMGYELQDNKKEMSTENKVVSNSIKFFHKCPCGIETMLTNGMFTDHAETKYGSMCGWSYKCSCGKQHTIWEGAFDSYIEFLYENDLIFEDQEFF